MFKFENVKEAPASDTVKIGREFSKDTHADKMNFTQITYRDENSQAWLFPVVQKVKLQFNEEKDNHHEYIPVIGENEFTNLATELLLGESSPAIKEGRAFGVQILSTGGGVHVAATFLKEQLGLNKVYFAQQTWEDYLIIFDRIGFVEKKVFRYWNNETCRLDIEGLLEDLNEAPENSVVILYSGTHYPTGVEPAQYEWKEIADVVEKRRHFPIFDASFQGFASGDLDKDAWAVRYFVDRGIEMMIAESFSWNFGLYSERVGNLVIVLKDPRLKDAVLSQLTHIIRGAYSVPPCYGSKIVTRILRDPTLRKEWIECLKLIEVRIKKIRESLCENLLRLNTPGKWMHVLKQNGVMAVLGLNDKAVEVLKNEFHIYVLPGGILNLSELNEKNIKYVTRCIHRAVKKSVNCVNI